MKKILHLPVLAFLSVGALTAHASTDTFPTGQSYWGQPATATSGSRTVDSQSKSVRVMYGETLVFKDDAGKQFAWTFNGLDRTAVDVSKIAPAGFHAAKTVVYVGQNPLTRN